MCQACLVLDSKKTRECGFPITLVVFWWPFKAGYQREQVRRPDILGGDAHPLKHGLRADVQFLRRAARCVA